MIAVYVIIGLIAVLLIIFIVMYNRLVSMHNQMKNLWAQVDVQLKRRHDLVPNLIETVKGYAQHERETLEEVTKARNLAQAAPSTDLAGRAEAETALSSALARLLLVVENYPDLKANQNFLALQGQLSTTENQISTARQKYNDMAMICNNLNQQFPSSIVARVFGFQDGQFFKVKLEQERPAPSVSFS